MLYNVAEERYLRMGRNGRCNSSHQSGLTRPEKWAHFHAVVLHGPPCTPAAGLQPGQPPRAPLHFDRMEGGGVLGVE